MRLRPYQPWTGLDLYLLSQNISRRNEKFSNAYFFRFHRLKTVKKHTATKDQNHAMKYKKYNKIIK